MQRMSPASGTAGQVLPGELFESSLPRRDSFSDRGVRAGSVGLREGDIGRGRRFVFVRVGVGVRARWQLGRLEQGSGLGKAGANVAGCVQAVVSELDEAGGQDVLHEPIDEVVAVEGTCVAVLGEEGDGVRIDAHQTLVADGDAVGVAAKVFEKIPRTGLGSLGVGDPRGRLQCVEQLLENVLVLQGSAAAFEAQVPTAVGIRQGTEESVAEQGADDIDMEQEIGVAQGDPAGAVAAKTATGNEAAAGHRAVRDHAGRGGESAADRRAHPRGHAQEPRP